MSIQAQPPFQEINPVWQQRLAGEPNKERRMDQRDPYQRDKARVLHSAAFRRLQSKTQIHNNGRSDFYRTRLTHSLEVAQIGSGIVAHLSVLQNEFMPLLPSHDLMETICLSHDIGHPPFGHGGETALNYMMADAGGFEGNAQTFRILTQLEPYTQYNGMNLTRRSLLGILKYPIFLDTLSAPYPNSTSLSFRELKSEQWLPAKGIYNHDSLLLNATLSPLSPNDKALFQTLRPQDDIKKHKKSLYKSLDCSIMEIADDIAYGVHDLEDAIAMGIIDQSLWHDHVIAQLQTIHDIDRYLNLKKLSKDLFSSAQYERKDAIGALVNALITSCEIRPVKASFTEPLLAYNAYLKPIMFNVLEILKHFVLNYVIKKPDLQIVEYRGQQIVMELFQAFHAGALRFLPEPTKTNWLAQDGDAAREKRVIADHISSLTDSHALGLHASLFSSHPSPLMMS
ncbi:deoxyguanosinetriphosphate triphosphohydrolase-like protein [Psychromonas sp. CNPT3]|uniref:anti-phage deoxyguanosine triphosphatase n=1 Tax=Psychromonas sp. CNPT3 TaxID=314282 RepID=UPI00006E8094|nr:anti-phage deoxyguanosine triphosphatase [Psychromonas sp. CNPT3]AGH80824.1 deoxyguanosinetriphosphate triphosphohydrolase-like protein [Psychromonas sp. CNPT3]